MTRFEWGLLVWGLLFFAFLCLELPAAFGKTPWPTLSSESWSIEKAWTWTQIVFLAGLAVLLVHIVFHWPK